MPRTARPTAHGQRACEHCTPTGSVHLRGLVARSRAGKRVTAVRTKLGAFRIFQREKKISCDCPVFCACAASGSACGARASAWSTFQARRLNRASCKLCRGLQDTRPGPACRHCEIFHTCLVTCTARAQPPPRATRNASNIECQLG